MYAACVNGDLSGVKECIEIQKVNPNAHLASDNAQGTSLHVAARYGHLEIVRYLTNLPSCRVDGTDINSDTAMHVASRKGHLEIVRFLIQEKGCDPMLRCGEEGWTPLHIACSEAHMDVIKFLSNEQGVDPSCTDYNGSTLLHLAKTVEVARFLIEEKQCDANLRDALSVTPLFAAFKNERLDVFRYLVFCGCCDITKMQINGWTILHAACKLGLLDVVKYLVNEQGLDPSCTNNDGSTPLHLVKTVEVAKFLIEEKQCYANLRDWSNDTPLFAAFKNDQLDVIRYLIFCGHCDVRTKRSNGWTTLHAACQLGMLDVVKYLVNERGLDPSCTANNGSTPLHHIKTVEIAKFLIEEKQCDANRRDTLNDPPLFDVYLNHRLEVFRYLVFCGHCDVTLKRSSGWTALHSACKLGLLDVVKYLVNEQGLDPSCTDNDGSTPLHCVESVEIAKFLVEEKQCDANRRDTLNYPPLFDAYLNHRLEVFRYLVFCGHCDVTLKHSSGWTALHSACKLGLLDVVKYLVNEQGLDPSCTDNDGSTPLHLVESVEIAKFLVEEKQCDANKINSWNKTPVSNAIDNELMDLFRYFMFCGRCDVTIKDSNGSTTLHDACQLGMLDVVKYLVNEQGLDPSCTDNDGSTPLHLVESVEIAKFLVEEKQCNANLKDVSNNTPLFRACDNYYWNVVRYLVFCGHYDVTLKNSNGWSTVHAACHCGLLDVVNYLIELDSSFKLSVAFSLLLEPESKKGWTPLHIACQRGHTKIMHCLLKKTHINPCCTDFAGKTCLQYIRNANTAVSFITASYSASGIFAASKEDLHAFARAVYDKYPNQLTVALCLACKHGHLLAAKSLFNEGADVSHQDYNGDTSLHIAAAAGHSDVVGYLIKRTRSTAIKNVKGNTALHLAAANGHLSAVKCLYNSTDYTYLYERPGENCRTPLHDACRSGQMEVVKYMLYEGVDPSCKDEDGNTPLHLAAQSGWLEVVQFIVQNFEQGILKVKNKINRTPIQEACINSHFHIGSYLISCVEPGLSPVLAASKHGVIDQLVCILCDGQGSLDEQDGDGNTSLHFAVRSDDCEMMKYIISTKAEQLYSLNKEGHVPIQTAIKCACMNVVRYMLQDPAWYRKASELSLMHIACHAGHLDLLKCLIQEFNFHLDCEDNEGKTPSFSAASAGNFKIIEYLHENQCNLNKVSKYGDTPLHVAALKGRTNIVIYLLSHHCKLEGDEFSWSALHAACQGGHLEVARYLVINAGINPLCLDKQQNIPLHYAARSGCLKLVKFLTEGRKCPRNPKNNHNNTPLHNAAVSGHVEIVKHLIEAGNCTPAERGYVEQTPLHYACQSGHYAVVKYLVEEQNVNASLRDERGCCALDVAAGYEDITAYLSEHLQSIENLSTKKLKLDTESDTETDIDTADAGPSTTEDDGIDLVTPAKRSRLTATQKRKRLFKNVSWMQKRDSSEVRAQLLPYTKKRAQPGQELGFGSYGRVVEIRIADNPKIYAGKIFKPSDCKEFYKTLCSEFSILSQLKHPNIVSYHGICELPKEEVPVLLMERLDANLHDYLCNKENENTELSAKHSILLDVANGLVYLHCQKPVIIHRDLTARNVLLDKYLNAKISDFGNARMMTYGYDMTPESFTSLPGTRDYMPPEAMDDIDSDEICYDTKLDVFSFGHLALFCGIQKPVIPLYQTYYDASNTLCYRSEIERRDRYMTELKTNLGSESHPLIQLIVQCLNDDPEERPSTETLRAQMKCLVPVKELDMRHLNEMYGYVHVLQKHQMIRLGMVLGLDYIKLTGKMDSPLFHEDVIKAWLLKEDYVTEDVKRRPTWANLVAALRHDTVGQNGVANLIYNHKGLKFL